MFNRSYQSGNLALSDEQLRANAPSIFATKPFHEVSDRYRFIPTIDVVKGLREKGFVPVKANQSRTRISGKAEFTKHIIRFRQEKDIGLTVGEGREIMELVLVNSHDRTSSYQLMLGIYRLVCSNGLIVGDTFSKVKTIHAGDRNLLQEVIQAGQEILENAPEVQGKIEAWKNINLTPEVQEAFAKSALELSPSTLQIDPRRLLKARRYQDNPDTNGNRNLWKTFNTIQENFTKGKVLGQGKNGKYRRTRAIKAVSADVKLNKALWVLTEEMEKVLQK